MSDSEVCFVWVFHGRRAQFASAVFTSRSRAAKWIAANNFSGTLSKYPDDASSSDA